MKILTILPYLAICSELCVRLMPHLVVLGHINKSVVSLISNGITSPRYLFATKRVVAFLESYTTVLRYNVTEVSVQIEIIDIY